MEETSFAPPQPLNPGDATACSPIGYITKLTGRSRRGRQNVHQLAYSAVLQPLTCSTAQ